MITAKYLPVEGKIKTGDWCIAKNGNLRFCTEAMENMFYDDGKVSGQPSTYYAHYRNYKKAQLFAVTQEFEVGKIHGIGKSSQGAEVIHKLEALGPISPGAIWVKDGDEIDAVEGKFLVLYDWLYYNRDSYYESDIYYVKCSQCNTYH